MALALDGSQQATFTNNATPTIALAPTAADCVLLLMLHFEHPTVARSVVSVADNQGLTWSRRSQIVMDDGAGGHFQVMEVWWAHATTTATHTVTLTLDGAPDDGTLALVAVSGAEFSDPWDSDVSLPATQENPGGLATATLDVSTNAAHTFIFGFFGSGFTSSPPDALSPFTQLRKFTNGGGSWFSHHLSQYLLAATPQSNLTVACNGDRAEFGYIVDALVALGEQTSESEPPSEMSSESSEPPSEISSEGSEPPSEVSSESSEPPSEVSSEGSEPPSELSSESSEPLVLPPPIQCVVVSI